jgi:hypothetical protein
VIDVREEQLRNALDSMRVSSEFCSNEIDENESQYEKHEKQTI